MATATYVQSSFLGGERSKTVQGRLDRPDYRTGMNVCINGIPIDAGAWVRRSGTQNAGTTRSGAPGRTMPFAFHEDQPFTLEFTDNHLRIRNVTDFVTSNDGQVVSSISTDNPAKVTVPVANTWLSGDQVFFTLLGVGTPLLLNRVFIWTKVNTTSGTLADAVTGATIDGSTLGTLASGAIINRVLDIVTPYAALSWEDAHSIQAELNSLMVHSSYPPQVLAAVDALSATSYPTFSLTPANFIDGPYLDPFVNGVLATPSAKTGVINLTLSFASWASTTVYAKGVFVTYSSQTYKSLVDQNLNFQPDTSTTKWQAVSAASAIGPNGFIGTDVGRHIRLFSEPPLWVVSGSYVSGNMVKYNKAYYTSLTTNTGTLANGPNASATNWAINPTGAVWTWGKITALLSMISASLSGSANIGNMVSGGGVNAAFDGVISKGYTLSPFLRVEGNIAPGQHLTVDAMVGKNYSGASDQTISSGTIYPTSDLGLGACVDSSQRKFLDMTINLRASASSPGSDPTAGTLLGSFVFPTTAEFFSNFAGFGTDPVTIISNDPVTEWKYVWFEIIVKITSDGSTSDNFGVQAQAAQAQFFTTGSGGNGVSVEILGGDLLYTSAITTWRLGLYNGANYPHCGTYDGGRIWLSGSVSNRIDASRPNQDITQGVSFAPTELDIGTVTDSNGISYTFDAEDVNTLFWMKSEQQGILCGTQAGEWLVTGSTDGTAITPTSIKARRVTRIGCADIEPRRTEHTTVFVQKYRRQVMEYFPDVFSGKFTAPNLAKDARHLTNRGVAEIAYQQELVPVVWSRCDDGSLIGCTYKRDTLMTSQGPTYAGWHQHVLGSGRVVESICVGPSADGTLDVLTMVTNDPNTQIRHVEVMQRLFSEGDAASSAWLVDNGIVPVATQAIVMGGVSSCRLTGLWHLNGQTVAAVIDGLDCGDFLVTNGAMYVPYGSAGGLFTQAFATAATEFVVGFTYTSDGQCVRPDLQAESGARLGPGFGSMKRTHEVAILLNSTAGIKIGTDFTHLRPIDFQSDGGTAYAANALFSGIWWDTLDDDSARDSAMPCWRSTRPYPATVCSISGRIKTQG